MSWSPRSTRPESGEISPTMHVKRGRLAGAVGTEQPHDFALLDLDRDVIDDLATAVCFGDFRCLKRFHVVYFLRMVLSAGLLDPPSTSSLSLLAHQVNCWPVVLPFTLSTSSGWPFCRITFCSSA